MNRVGIVTFHYAYNYGAVLQCLSTHTYLKLHGYSPLVINYSPPSKQISSFRGWGLRSTDKVYYLISKLAHLMCSRKAKKSFDSFRAMHLTLSPLCTASDSLFDVITDCSIIVAGSDQIWNYTRNKYYFLEFGFEYAGKRISYAPCCGSPEIPDDYDPMIITWLNRFSSLSVRDQFSSDIVKKTTDRLPAIVADPALLVDLSFAESSSLTPSSRYFLLYMIGKPLIPLLNDFLKKLRAFYGNLPIVSVSSGAHHPHFLLQADANIFSASPGDWLSLVKNATFVITDSFHCSLYSIKYDTPFVTFLSTERRSHRLLDLSSRYGLCDHVVSSSKDLFDSSIRDMMISPTTKCLVDAHIKYSSDYLSESLTN